MPDATVTTGGASVKSSTEVTLSGSFAQASSAPTEVGFYWGTSSASMTNKVKSTSSVSGKSGSFSINLTVPDPSKTCYYKAYAVVSGTESYSGMSDEFTASSYGSFLIGLKPSVNVTTGVASSVSQSGATLSASFSDATSVPSEVGFYWGTSSTSLPNKVTATRPSGKSGSFTVSLTGLSAGTRYYYRAYAKVSGTGSFSGTVLDQNGTSADFATESAPVVGGSGEPALNYGWLEMPSDPRAKDSDSFVSLFRDGSARNYSYLYDKSMYTTMWAAYPVYSSVMGGSYSASWKANPQLSQSEQINIWSGSYKVNYEGELNNTIYSRGHIVPDASRDGNSNMIKEAYYATNQVPQIQDNFNGGIWSNLEGAIRAEVSSASDTVYVVTGVAFSKVGENKSVTYISPKYDTKDCPVPNYFYKVALKVKRSGSSVTSASAIGFWFVHKQYSDKYFNYAVSVDQIEQWTGMDFFVNLPEGVEVTAEQNASWTDFQNF